MSRECAHCQKLEPPQASTGTPGYLKQCAKCRSVLYCSRDCQKVDWKRHKKHCGTRATEATAPQSPPSTSQGSEANELDQMLAMFSGNLSGSAPEFLRNASYLSSLPEIEAFAIIVDSYRMRVEDEYVFRGNVRGRYAEEDELLDFRKYLTQAEDKGGILPKWWSGAKRSACERFACDTNQWSDISCAVEKADIIEHYKDRWMPMKLRMIGQLVTGSKVDSL